MYKLVISVECALHFELCVKLRYHNGENERGVESGSVVYAHSLCFNLYMQRYMHIMCLRLFIEAVSR